jgi:hypothetical protein
MGIWVCLGISLALTTQALHLTAHGSAIESVRLEVFDLGGQKIFDSGPVPGATYKWYLQRDDGRPVANGVYLYLFVTRTTDGREVRSSVGKIAVRR